MKSFFSIFLCICLLLCLSPVTVFALDNSRSYDFALTVDGAEEISALPEQIVTVTLVLSRTDSSEASDMYAAQAELLYDDTFFELVEDSIMTAPGVEWTDMARRTGGRAFYLNFLSLAGGEEWPAQVQMGTFRMKVIAQSGASVIRSENCLVSVANGSDSFASTDNDVKVVVSTDCTVKFESGGGSGVPEQVVQYGEKVTEPEEPARDGYTFNGWYRDLDKTELWDFENDAVTGNMTLYAGWLEGEAPAPAVSDEDGGGFPWWLISATLLLLLLLFLLLLLLLGKKKVTFDSCGGTQLEPIRVRKNSTIERPMTPIKPGAMFAGWYTEAQDGRPWVFEQDEVKKNMTLYARWR